MNEEMKRRPETTKKEVLKELYDVVNRDAKNLPEAVKMAKAKMLYEAILLGGVGMAARMMAEDEKKGSEKRSP